MILLLAALVWVIAAGLVVRSALRMPGIVETENSGLVDKAPASSAALAMARGTMGLDRTRLSQDEGLRDIAAIGTIGIATGLFFWRLLAGQIWMPAGGGDLAQFLYPTYRFAAEWWRRGVIPLWNPYLFGGAPFVGDIQSGIFYPLNLLTFLVSNPLTFRDMEFLSVLHFLIAGLGMYAFLRWGKLGLSRPAAFAGAIAFEYSDLFITHFGNLNLIAVAAWMPLVLLFYRRAVIDRRPVLAVVAGIALGTAFLAGHIQSFLFIVVGLVFWAAFETIDRRLPTADRGRSSAVGAPTPAGLPLVLLAITGLVAFGIAAPSLLPSIEMTQNTLRVDFPYEQAAQFSLPPAQLIGLFVPGFFGRGPQNTWAPWPRVEVGYLGVLPLVLALMALVLRRDGFTRGFGTLALLGLGLALGGYAILHGWLYQFAPVFGQLRAPARFIFLFDFAMAALAALGFDCMLHALPRPSAVMFKLIVRAIPWAFLLIALAAGSVAFAILTLGQGQDAVLFARMAATTNALAFFILLLGLSVALILARSTRFIRRPAWIMLALALIFFDLYSLGAYVDASADDPARTFEHPDAVAYLKSDPGPFRTDSRGTGVDAMWPADTAILHGLFDVNGDNPLVLADFDRYWQSLGSRSTALYDLLNVKYLIGRKNVPLDREKFKLAFDGDPAVDVFENSRVLPRAMFVFDSQTVPNEREALEAIHASDFDPAQSIVLEGPVNGTRIRNTEQITRANADGATGAVKITGYGPNEVLLETNAARSGFVLLSEMYYPGWRAWVDESEVQVLRADYLYRAVETPAGAHRMRLLYDPMPFKIGAGLFAVTVLGLIALCAVGIRRRE